MLQHTEEMGWEVNPGANSAVKGSGWPWTLPFKLVPAMLCFGGGQKQAIDSQQYPEFCFSSSVTPSAGLWVYHLFP